MQYQSLIIVQAVSQMLDVILFSWICLQILSNILTSETKLLEGNNKHTNVYTYQISLMIYKP